LTRDILALPAGAGLKRGREKQGQREKTDGNRSRLIFFDHVM
jgi:hypothetical protein